MDRRQGETGGLRSFGSVRPNPRPLRCAPGQSGIPTRPFLLGRGPALLLACRRPQPDRPANRSRRPAPATWPTLAAPPLAAQHSDGNRSNDFAETLSGFLALAGLREVVAAVAARSVCWRTGSCGLRCTQDTDEDTAKQRLLPSAHSNRGSGCTPDIARTTERVAQRLRGAVLVGRSITGGRCLEETLPQRGTTRGRQLAPAPGERLFHRRMRLGFGRTWIAHSEASSSSVSCPGTPSEAGEHTAPRGVLAYWPTRSLPGLGGSRGRWLDYYR
jgi:hypothetical protein